MIQLGQRVYTNLYSRGRGIVVRIHGEQSPESVSRFCGVAVMGGTAAFDIVFDYDGARTDRLPESILISGGQWEILDEIATADEIIDAVQRADVETARRKAEAEATEARRAAERKQHLATNPHLVPAASDVATTKKLWGGKLVAHNVRIELKKAFPGFKFSVTSDHNSCDVKWAHGPTTAQVKPILSKYRAGHFDGMTDCYSHDRDATFSQVFGAVEYANCYRSRTQESIVEAWRRAGRDVAEVPAAFEQRGCLEIDDWKRREINEVYDDTDLTGWAPTPVEKPTGPFWSRRNLLATDESGWTRDFRKREIAEREAAKLTAAGFTVRVYETIGRKGTFVIERIVAT